MNPLAERLIIGRCRKKEMLKGKWIRKSLIIRMNHNPTVLEISLNAVKHNLNYFRSKIGKDTMVLAVVKASGYGTDPTGIASFLEENGVNYFAVAYADEGIA